MPAVWGLAAAAGAGADEPYELLEYSGGEGNGATGERSSGVVSDGFCGSLESWPMTFLNTRKTTNHGCACQWTIPGITQKPASLGAMGSIPHRLSFL